MERWVNTLSGYRVVKEIDEFIAEIEQVCRKYELSIGHQDGHGAFLIEYFNEANIDWLKDANDARPTPEPTP